MLMKVFIVPGWKQFLEALGGVIGTREICGALMEKGEPLLVFPGGADEVLKTEKDAKNVLKWKQRTGFAHMAAQHKYLIVPFATIGIEDAFSIWFSLSATWFYALIGDMRSSKNVKVPIIKPFFKPQAVYMWFGEPVDTSNYNIADSQSIFELRETVRLQVQRGLSDCLDRQKKDTNRYHNVFKTARMRLMSSISNEKRAL
ncbi:hypothetical protein BC829DRAFT_179897 [Chytridium lagenaria]|nr:hypothetical protein BC829DRAFT_179897 [Chytridium lagenaria]